MKASSIDLREKIVTAHFLDKISIRKVAIAILIDFLRKMVPIDLRKIKV